MSGILNDKEIERLALEGMIEPFVDKQTNEGIVSYGLSSFGYDIRAAREWKVSREPVGYPVVDVKDPRTLNTFMSYKGDSCIIPPRGFALTRSVEYIRMPKDIMCIALGKSTYARVGLIANITPLEPMWRGHITLELSNTNPFPVKVYANEGIVQLLFFRGELPAVTYADREGKYQGQEGITLAKV